MSFIGVFILCCFIVTLALMPLYVVSSGFTYIMLMRLSSLPAGLSKSPKKSYPLSKELWSWFWHWINISKSSFYTAKHCPSTQVNIVHTLTGFRQKKFLFIYLSCPIYYDTKQISYFKTLHRRLALVSLGAQSNSLSMSGRLIFVKHILQSISMYIVATLDSPKQVLKDIERLFSKFLWGSHEGVDKCHWMSWTHIYRPTCYNGHCVIPFFFLSL